MDTQKSMETMLQQMQKIATQIDQISRCDIDPILFNDWANIWLKTWRKGLVSNITYEETYKDAGGRAAEQHIRELLDETQYEIVSLRQSVGKDWNEYLDKWRQIAEDAALPEHGAAHCGGDAGAAGAHSQGQDTLHAGTGKNNPGNGM